MLNGCGLRMRQTVVLLPLLDGFPVMIGLTWYRLMGTTGGLHRAGPTGRVLPRSLLLPIMHCQYLRNRFSFQSFPALNMVEIRRTWITEMFNDIPSKFPRIFALMWFSQSKSAEADWAVNTSDAALNAWKEGISKIDVTVSTKEKFRSVVYRDQYKNKTVLTLGMLNSNKNIFDFKGRKLNNKKAPISPSGIFIEHSSLQIKK